MKRSEFEFIAALRLRAEQHRRDPGELGEKSDLIIGIGDDAAVYRGRSMRDSVVTADMLVEDIDFRRQWMPPALLGHNALAVSLSDVAAMGARPRYAVMSIGVPSDVWESNFLDEFHHGLFALADQHAVTLIGGDVSRTPDRIVLNSTVIGDVRRNRAVMRSGANPRGFRQTPKGKLRVQPGDEIFVTGSLGGAAAGLGLLEAGARLSPQALQDGDAANVIDRLLLRHLRPVPRLTWGEWLAESRLATAMIDISDGLSSDVTHLCEASGVGARIFPAQLPIEPGITLQKDMALDELALALHGGEDYELLFTVRPSHVSLLPRELNGVPLHRIGEVMPLEEGIQLSGSTSTQKLEPRGYQHFTCAARRTAEPDETSTTDRQQNLSTTEPTNNQVV